MKKGWMKRIGVFLLLLCLTLTMVPQVSVSAASGKQGLVKEKNNLYYYNSKGKKVTNTWETVKGKKYYFGENGAAKKGCWYTAKSPDGKAYFTYYFNKNGAYSGKNKAIDSDLVTRMDALIKGQKITAKTANKTAIKKLYNLVKTSYGYGNAVGFKPESAEKGWENTFAKAFLEGSGASCYHYASGLAFLIRRATGLDVRIGYGDAEIYTKGKTQPHGWVEVKLNGKWYTYDPLVEKYSSNRKGLNFKLYQLKSATAQKYYKAKGYINVEI